MMKDTYCATVHFPHVLLAFWRGHLCELLTESLHEGEDRVFLSVDEFLFSQYETHEVELRVLPTYNGFLELDDFSQAWDSFYCMS